MNQHFDDHPTEQNHPHRHDHVDEYCPFFLNSNLNFKNLCEDIAEVVSYCKQIKIVRLSLGLKEQYKKKDLFFGL